MYNTQSNKLSKTNQGHICQILCSMWTTSHNGIKYNHEHREHHPLHANAYASTKHVYLIQINELRKTQKNTFFEWMPTQMAHIFNYVKRLS